MRMSMRLRAEAASAIFSQSLSRRLPVMSRVFSTRPSLAIRRVTSCSRDISSEKMATVLPDSLAAFSATFSAILVLPMPGRAASSSRSDLFRPLILPSTADKPVDRPGTLLPPLALSSASWLITSCSTTLMGPCPGRCGPGGWRRSAAPPPPARRRALPVPCCTMAVMSAAAAATAAAGLSPARCARTPSRWRGGRHLHQLDQIARVCSLLGPFFSISPATVTPSMGLE